MPKRSHKEARQTPQSIYIHAQYQIRPIKPCSYFPPSLVPLHTLGYGPGSVIDCIAACAKFVTCQYRVQPDYDRDHYAGIYCTISLRTRVSHPIS